MPTRIIETKVKEEVDRYTVKIDQLLNISSSQIDQFVDNNITDLASIRDSCSKIIRQWNKGNLEA